MDLLNIEIDDGKYTLIQRADGSGEILRYGEPWMAPLCNVAGSKMILAMGYELERLRAIEQAAVRLTFGYQALVEKRRAMEPPAPEWAFWHKPVGS